MERTELCNNLSSKLQILEANRKSRLLKIMALELLLLVVFLVLAFCIYVFIPILPIFAIIDFLILVLIIVIPRFANKWFKGDIKDSCKKIIEKAFNLTYLNETIFYSGKLRKSNLFTDFNELNIDDVYKSTYKNVEYTVQETELMQVTHSSEGTEKKTVFKGLIIGFNFNKSINAKTIIAPKRDSVIAKNSNNKLGLFILISIGVIADSIYTFGHYRVDGKAFFPILYVPELIVVLIFIIYSVLTKNSKKMKNTELEDVVFNKYYKVQTEDEVEARYLITTSFMTRFMALQKVFHTKKIKCSFFDNEVIFAIETNKDIFELGSLYHSLNKDNKDIKEFVDQIESIQNMIDHFKLNEKTGL